MNDLQNELSYYKGLHKKLMALTIYLGFHSIVITPIFIWWVTL
jgi:hypothetical protein